VLIVGLALAGCAYEADKAASTYYKQDATHHGLHMESEGKVGGGKSGESRKGDAREEAAFGPNLPEQPAAGGERKLIMTATLRLKVVDFGRGQRELLQIVKDHKGYVAQTEVSASAGGVQQGMWRVRIPPAEYGTFCEAVKKTGELTYFSSDAKDVSEEYFDLQLRLKNKETELAALRKIQETNTGKIEDVLAAQREVNRAQLDMERLTGRQRYLDNMIDLTTVTIYFEEQGTFSGTTPLPPRAFGTRIEEAFFGSIDALVTASKAVVVGLVAALPWVPVAAIPVAGLWWARRRNRKAA
jgi:hypothetical protein